MSNAKDKFSKRKYKKEKNKVGLASVDGDSLKNEENELLATDSENGAPAGSAMFEPVKVEDNVDYEEGGRVT